MQKTSDLGVANRGRGAGDAQRQTGRAAHLPARAPSLAAIRRRATRDSAVPNSGIAKNTGAETDRGGKPEEQAHNRQPAQRAVVGDLVEVFRVECRLVRRRLSSCFHCQFKALCRQLPAVESIVSREVTYALSRQLRSTTKLDAFSNFSRRS